MFINKIFNSQCYHSKEDEMLEHSETWEKHVVLGTEAEGVPGLSHVAPDVVSVDLGVPGGRGEQTCQHRHCRGLPRTVVAQQGGDLTLEGIESHVVNRNHLLPAAEHLPEAADLDTFLLGRLTFEERLVMEQ